MHRVLTYTVICVFLFGDLGFSFLQYYSIPLDGDMVGGVLLDEGIEPVLSHPLGLHAIVEGKAYPNPNRFFSHWLFYQYFQYAPLALQTFLSPIDSIYAASALIKILTHLLFVAVLAMMVSGRTKISSFNFLLGAVLISPFFQTNGYRSYMSIIDYAPTYVFFYAIPLLILILYFLPLFWRAYHGRELLTNPIQLLIGIPLALIASLSGPLNPGIALIIGLLVGCIGGLSYISEKRLPKNLKGSLPLLILIGLVSLYSLMLARYNSISLVNEMPLWDLYAKLPQGIFYQFTAKLCFPLIFIALIVNVYVLRKHSDNPVGQKILRWGKWVGLFMLIYLLLLPLGGYRPYRPYILRYDTIMPITLGLVFLFGLSTHFILTQLKGQWYTRYAIWTGVFLFIFMWEDKGRFDQNQCERKALEAIAQSPATETIVQLPQECRVLSWEAQKTFDKSSNAGILLRQWNIIKQ